MPQTPSTMAVVALVNTHILQCRLLQVLLLELVLAAALAIDLSAATPLHRCARESWPVENYHAYIFHRGELDPADQELVEVMASAPAKLGLNLLVSTVETLRPELGALWEVQTNAELPWLVVQSPRSFRSNTFIWATALRTPAVGALLTSPARQRVAEHLMEGHVAVWLLVECGEAIRDEAAVDTLTAALAQLSKSNRPAQTDAPGKLPVAPAPQFSFVRVTRDDPAEQFLLRSLGIEAEDNPLPIIIPIFGRGRTLPPLIGRKLTEPAVINAGRLLLAECTNSLNDATSGSELLLGAAWGTPSAALVIHSTNSAATNATGRDAETNPIAENSDALGPRVGNTEPRMSNLEWLGGFAAGVALAALAGFAIVRVWRSRQ